MHILGIDVGGTGIKSARVNTATGHISGKKIRTPTPCLATPEEVARILREHVDAHGWDGPIGLGFPAVIREDTVYTAANISASFIGLPMARYFSEQTGLPVFALNDADAAGIAEMRFGAGKDVSGSVLVVTIGTGLGTALFIDGKLLPNTELGHLLLDNGQEAERYASESARIRRKLNWKAWGKRFNRYLTAMEQLFWPELIILGGGVSKRYEKFASAFTTRAPVTTAQHFNRAGIIGAALYAESRFDASAISRKPA